MAGEIVPKHAVRVARQAGQLRFRRHRHTRARASQRPIAQHRAHFENLAALLRHLQVQPQSPAEQSREACWTLPFAVLRMPGHIVVAAG